MTDISRRNLFAAGAAERQPGRRRGGRHGDDRRRPDPPGRQGHGDPRRPAQRLGEVPVAVEPPANYKRNTTPGPNTIRLSGQTTPRMTGTDYAAILKGCTTAAGAPPKCRPTPGCAAARCQDPNPPDQGSAESQ